MMLFSAQQQGLLLNITTAVPSEDSKFGAGSMTLVVENLEYAKLGRLLPESD